MARLYFDHNFTRRVGPALWAEGYDLLFTCDPGLAKLSDDAHLLTSVRAERVLVTHDRHDFRLLHDAWMTWPAAFGLALPAHPGILTLDSAPPDTLARVLADFLVHAPAERLANGIFWWRRHTGWQQALTGASWEPFRLAVDSPEE